MGGMSPERVAGLADRLADPPTYTTVDPSRYASVEQVVGLSRYAVGDVVRVERTGGHFTLGVVAELPKDGPVSVVVRSQANGRPSVKDLDPLALEAANPLKIADVYVIRGVPFRVTGLDEDGELCVETMRGDPIDPSELRSTIEAMFPKSVASEVRAAVPKEGLPASTTQPMASLRIGERRRYVPIESILGANTGQGLIAGNKETDTVFDLQSPLAGAALHTDRGRNYKSWNEDGGALFADSEGRLYLGVFDQAGGEGSDARARGRASAIAAEMLFDEMQSMAKERRGLDMAESALLLAAKKAHQAIVARGRGEVTTFVGAVIDDRRAVIVNIGDSGAIQFTSKGRPKRRTERQGIGRLLLEGLGIVRSAGFQHETYVWKVERGDLVVFGTDGLFDSGLSELDIGRIVVEAGSAADATRRLRDVVRARMVSREGKPDNLTVLVVRVGDQP